MKPEGGRGGRPLTLNFLFFLDVVNGRRKVSNDINLLINTADYCGSNEISYIIGD
jgi:hypothetical protein